MRRRLGISIAALMLAFPAAALPQGNERPRPAPPSTPPGFDQSGVVLPPEATTPQTGPGNRPPP